MTGTAVITHGIVLVAGVIIGALIVERMAKGKVEDAIGYGVDTILGKGSAYGGVAKTFVNAFVESS